MGQNGLTGRHCSITS